MKVPGALMNIKYNTFQNLLLVAQEMFLPWRFERARGNKESSPICKSECGKPRNWSWRSSSPQGRRQCIPLGKRNIRGERVAGDLQRIAASHQFFNSFEAQPVSKEDVSFPRDPGSSERVAGCFLINQISSDLH
jgi:hypothetical protein